MFVIALIRIVYHIARKGRYALAVGTYSIKFHQGLVEPGRLVTPVETGVFQSVLSAKVRYLRHIEILVDRSCVLDMHISHYGRHFLYGIKHIEERIFSGLRLCGSRFFGFIEHLFRYLP